MAGCDSSELSIHEKITQKMNNISDDVEAKENEEPRAHIVQLGHRHGHGHGHDDNHGGCNFDAVERIIKGFRSFLKKQYRKYPEKFAQLAENQSPKFLVFSCSDSRVSPSHIIDFQVGDAFGVRNIAGLVPTFDKLRHSDAGATIEYAVEHLKVENILVIGHSRCGGITRLMSYPEDGSAPSDFLDDWVSIALPAKEKVKAEFGHLPFEEQRDLCVQESVNVSLANIQTYPYVQKAVEEGKLALRGAYYDFVVGSLKLWEFKSNIITPPIIIN